MFYIDPHIHMISRVTDDYQRMAQCGCVALSEPAFWAGFDRGSAEGFRDYFRHLTEVEPKRAAQFGIKHFSWLCINAKEAENVKRQRGQAGEPSGRPTLKPASSWRRSAARSSRPQTCPSLRW